MTVIIFAIVFINIVFIIITVIVRSIIMILFFILTAWMCVDVRYSIETLKRPK